MPKGPILYIQTFPGGFSPEKPPPAPVLENIKNGGRNIPYQPPAKSNSITVIEKERYHKKKPNKNSKNTKVQASVKTVKVNKQYLNILSTNAADLHHKAEDLKNKVRFFKNGIFAIQETHFRKKGKLKMQDYQIFESIIKK